MASENSKQRRSQKEANIIDAAEKVFSAVGYSNTKMEEIAKEAGVSKGTVYFYFDTKENLYMAVTYRALQLLNDSLYRTRDSRKTEPGLESVLALAETYLDFCARHFFYSEVILDYMTLNRSTQLGKDRARMTDAIKESMYYRMVQDIQNLPVNLITGEIARGVEDGSILNRNKPELLYLVAWGAVVGFVKLNVAAGSFRTTLHHVNVQEWRDYLIEVLRSDLLKNHVLKNQDSGI
ncbi:MAG: TetR/AcrR family transcriptional regulator [Saprospiraceae bacterium]|nr:TetR/AcrR family transcriptional regulator [Saprospiraceae bacterium]